MKISHSFSRLFLITFVLGSFALCQVLQAVMPKPDGGYPGGNTAEGQDALFSLTPSGTFNTANGLFSLRALTTGKFNTGVGAGALLSNTADENTATGAGALLSNTTGVANTANGGFALVFNTTGANNTATGDRALFSNTTGGFNTATGDQALFHNTVGDYNTANGYVALTNNIDGPGNTATGAYALAFNSTGEANTATGVAALFINSTGVWNTAVGWNALNVSNGSRNTATGYKALINNTTGDDNTAVGYLALAFSGTGSGNIALGANAGSSVTTASNVICIGGNVAGANVSNTCFVGNIFGVTTGMDAASVVVDSNGQLGTVASSRRFKRDIQPMDKASEAILSLQPVTFHYKSTKKDTPQFGLIAEDVAKLNPDLVVRDKDGEIYSVRYEAVNAMLLNEFLKEHRKVEGLESTIAKQEKQIEALASGLRRVNAQVEVTKFAAGRIRRGGPTAQVVVTNP
jgi:hypothetical protein